MFSSSPKTIAAQLARVEEINELFTNMQPQIHKQYSKDTALLKKLSDYQAALIAEAKYLDPKYDHPLRAAKALKRVIEDPSDANKILFQQVATDSKFNPNARAIAWGILLALAFVGLITLIVSSVLLGDGAPLPIIIEALWLVPTISAGLGIPLGMCLTIDRFESYAPVSTATKKGAEVAQLFFKPLTSNDNVESSMATANPVGGRAI